MLRALPNFDVFRQADARETAAAGYAAVSSTRTPTAIALTRQNLPQIDGTGKEALKGGYVVKQEKGAAPALILIASGSELSLAVEAAKVLEEKGVDVRVVSMPCMDRFEKQDEAYKEAVLPKAVRARVALEAGCDFGWGKYVGLDGATVTMPGFGASAPYAKLFDFFGFTVDHVVETAEGILK